MQYKNSCLIFCKLTCVFLSIIFYKLGTFFYRYSLNIFGFVVLVKVNCGQFYPEILECTTVLNSWSTIDFWDSNKVSISSTTTHFRLDINISFLSSIFLIFDSQTLKHQLLNFFSLLKQCSSYSNTLAFNCENYLSLFQHFWPEEQAIY